MFNRQTIEQAVAVLKQKFGDRLSQNENVRSQHSHTTSRIPRQLPDAVIFAKSADEVAEIISVCHEHKCPVIAFGVGSSLEGHVNAPYGGICIDMNGMDQIIKVNPEDMDAVIQPGVTREALNEYLRDTGLFFPIDPGANASLGGMAATRASGTNAVRYGTMKDNILALQAVLPNGRLIRTGGRARKSSAGYDLTRLLIGSEGTLGVITEITLKLQGIPEMIAGASVHSRQSRQPVRLLSKLFNMAFLLLALNYLMSYKLRPVTLIQAFRFRNTLLLIEFHGTEKSVAEQAEQFTMIAKEHTDEHFVWTTDPAERKKLWKARHDAYYATMALIPGRLVCQPMFVCRSHN